MRENSEHEGEQHERDDSPEEAPTDATGENALVEDAAVLKDRWLRAAAELQNVRKRTAREIELESRRQREKLLGEFMKVVDNLERALGSEQSEHNPWYEGMVAIREQMLDLLKRNGAVPFDAAGEQFDPNRHEATGKVEMPGLATGAIIDVLERGYQAEDGTIIRPAKVIVAKAPAG
jgi:molecular chaperone GrpE